MAQFLSSLVCCPKGAVLCPGRCLAPGRLHQSPQAFAAQSAVGAVKGMGDLAENYSPIPIHPSAAVAVQGTAGIKQGHGHTSIRSEVSAQ